MHAITYYNIYVVLLYSGAVVLMFNALTVLHSLWYLQLVLQTECDSLYYCSVTRNQKTAQTTILKTWAKLSVEFSTLFKNTINFLELEKHLNMI